jgi:non-homologous end joining protein Ku
VIDLMALLKKSVEKRSEKPEKPKRHARKRRAA